MKLEYRISFNNIPKNSKYYPIIENRVLCENKNLQLSNKFDDKLQDIFSFTLSAAFCTFVFNGVRTNSFVKENFNLCPKCYTFTSFTEHGKSSYKQHTLYACKVNHYKVIYLVCLRSSLVMLFCTIPYAHTYIL